MEYKKYKWFYTSSGKLVVGGKSAEQNDELLSGLKKNYYVMHTSHPGSPFCVIVADTKEVTAKDIDECAIFTGCFSRAWKEGKKKTKVHIFKKENVSKPSGLKSGTWIVQGKVKEKEVDLELALTMQKGILRAVPIKSAEEIIAVVCPGKIDKKDMIPKFSVIIGEKITEQELLAALPAGGLKICKH